MKRFFLKYQAIHLKLKKCDKNFEENIVAYYIKIQFLVSVSTSLMEGILISAIETFLTGILK